MSFFKTLRGCSFLLKLKSPENTWNKNFSVLNSCDSTIRAVEKRTRQIARNFIFANQNKLGR